MSVLKSVRPMFAKPGSREDSRHYRPGLEVLEPRVCLNGSWATKAPMPAARDYAASAVIGNSLYVAGGHDGQHQTPTLQAYNASTNSWTTLASMPSCGRYGDVAGAINGKIYIAGGWDNQFTFLPHNELFIYDPASHSWTSGANMSHLSGSGAAGVINGKLYVTTPDDGYDGNRKFLDTYDPSSNRWTSLPQSPHAHDSPAFGVINGKLYVAGGNDNGMVATTVLDVYDPATNTWATKAPMLMGFRSGASAVVNGKLYAVGGADAAGNNLAKVQVYDPVNNYWTTDTSMPTARSGAMAGVVNALLYTVGAPTTRGPKPAGVTRRVGRIQPTTGGTRGPTATGERTALLARGFSSLACASGLYRA